MVVRTQSDGRTITGLYIGSRNVRRNFPRHSDSIELELGDLLIECKLAPEFRRGKPEILDSRLGKWLESKVFHCLGCKTPVPLVMVHVKKNAFRLHPFRLPPASVTQVVPLAALPSQERISNAESRPCGTVCRPRVFIACHANFGRSNPDW